MSYKHSYSSCLDIIRAAWKAWVALEFGCTPKIQILWTPSVEPSETM